MFGRDRICSSTLHSVLRYAIPSDEVLHAAFDYRTDLQSYGRSSWRSSQVPMTSGIASLHPLTKVGPALVQLWFLCNNIYTAVATLHNNELQTNPTILVSHKRLHRLTSEIRPP